ncbi:hypothetical protein GTY65_00325 [Streptomyces sp. SID8379]|uniref:hypothetical protein n=1 Tax=unclassified Streptomyces TaxID=2593676 RepID=UPI000399F917|nr:MULTISPECIES: hypothetical protein [unclassified Streptomyces]MYW62533.1 hypothetical protein [Streptomyces sp. SID8379]
MTPDDGFAARKALFRLRLMRPEIAIVWADLAYAGTFVARAKSFLHLPVKTAQRIIHAPICRPVHAA